jgi:hypothetical protein
MSLTLLTVLLGVCIDVVRCDCQSVSGTNQRTSQIRQEYLLGSEPEKAEQITIILKVIDELARMAKSNSDVSDADPNTETRKKIYDEVDKINNAEQLVILGRICRSILATQQASDVAYDKIFNIAFWHCVKRLSENTSDAGVRGLKMLWLYSNTDAGDTRLFKDAIRFQATRKTHK